MLMRTEIVVVFSAPFFLLSLGNENSNVRVALPGTFYASYT